MLKKIKNKISRLMNKISRLMNDGERIVHLYNNNAFYAFLSIYNFATQYTKEKIVLDAGSGNGYGSDFLAKNGAKKVFAIELDKKSVGFSKKNFKNHNLNYKDGNLENIDKIFIEDQFDVVFSSNVLEHIPNVLAVLNGIKRVLKQDGVCVLAVPPLYRENFLIDLNTIWHVNHWSIKFWYKIISYFFSDVQLYTHKFKNESVSFVLDNTPEATTINEKDYNFTKIDIDSVDDSNFSTITAVFVARNPKKNEIDNIAYFDNSYVTNSPLDYKINSKVIISDNLKSDGSNIGPLEKGLIFKQQFIANKNGLIGIALNMATYCERIKSIIKLSIYNEENKILREVEINTEEIDDNIWFPFNFIKIKNTKNNVYYFTIETIEDFNNKKYVTVWSNKNKKIMPKTIKNNSNLKETLCFRCCYQDNLMTEI